MSTMLSTCIVLLAMARLSGGDVSCATACARCRDRPASELAAVYCSLCRECRDRRREWLETAPPARRNMAPVNRPNYYREVGYYRKDATVWNAPGGNYPVSGCPPPPSCDDFAYVKVYGLKRTACPPAPPCVTIPQTYVPRSRKTRPPRSRRTRSPYITTAHLAYANQCCPMFMPMVPYSCICPVGAGVYGPSAGAHGPSSGANVVSQVAGGQPLTTSQSSAPTEPVYLYIGIPKDMQSLADNKA